MYLNMEILLSDICNIALALGVFIIVLFLARFDKNGKKE